MKIKNSEQFFYPRPQFSHTAITFHSQIFYFQMFAPITVKPFSEERANTEIDKICKNVDMLKRLQGLF